jgi:hypothetical protein
MRDIQIVLVMPRDCDKSATLTFPRSKERQLTEALEHYCGWQIVYAAASDTYFFIRASCWRSGHSVSVA